MDDAKLKNPAPPLLLPVSSMEDKKQQTAPAPSTPPVDQRKKKPPPPPPPRFPALHGVSWCALSAACAFAVFAAYATARLAMCSAEAADDRAAAWWCRGLAGAAADRARAVLLPQLVWCAALQATAAAAALLLPGRRRSRWALALVAFGATAGNHSRFAALIGLIMGTTAADFIGMLWVLAGGVYLLFGPVFAMLGFGALVMEYLEEYHVRPY